ncbi:Slam-dependent surface lipoprotein [Vibrio harveyi]|uniref:Slam-dependent surface lipoprotein n=1 Tax=Vibrio harveyi TaxID=669 RepID=UPI002119D0F9|nr:Slam-dependent surface lipoprotein [Vibrio harveyi]MCQ9084377.1 transferrin-binding protein-like solute binding protein [Vibrio harveyi]
MKPLQLSWIAAAMIGLSPLVHAGFDGAISDDSLRQVGESEVWVPFIHSKGNAGIGKTGGKRVDFEGLAGGIFDDERNGVHTSGSKHFQDNFYSFVQVANQDVWFGEWYEGKKDSEFNNRTVYYVGNDAGTTVPTSGKATYNITGINKFSGANKLSGTFNADFGAKTLDGSINNSNLTVSVDATINTATAAFNGTAQAVQNGTTTNGASQGHFFGANAAGLAGIATFTNNSDLDTAFGGEKK